MSKISGKERLKQGFFILVGKIDWGKWLVLGQKIVKYIKVKSQK